jgi:alkanesulfonate monooxygenase SsuD/methylene tetrahydromethanopterin reductase-like flavin-dependent oxidoreductase (luciferase family)
MRTSLVNGLLHFSPTTESTPQWLVVGPFGPGSWAWCAGHNAFVPCRHMSQPAGKATRGWIALRCAARGRRTVTVDPRVGRRVSASNRAGADPKIRQPSPAWNQAYRRSSHSVGTEVRTGSCGRLKSRTHTRVEAERRHFVGPKPWKRGLRPRRCRSVAVEPSSWGVWAAEAAASTSGISSDRSRARPTGAGRGRVSNRPPAEAEGQFNVPFAHRRDDV